MARSWGHNDILGTQERHSGDAAERQPQLN